MPDRDTVVAVIEAIAASENTDPVEVGLTCVRLAAAV